MRQASSTPTANLACPPSADRHDVVAPSTFSGHDLSHAILGAVMVLVVGTALVDSSRLPLLLIPLSFILASYAAGHTFIRAIQGPVSFSSMLHLAVHTGVGVACLSLIATLCAFSSVFRVAGLLTVAFAVYGMFILVPLCFRFRPCREGIPAFASGLALGGCWLVVWLWTTIPPTFFDELSFHLVAPERTLATGRIHTAPWVVFTLMPHAANLLFAWGIAFGGDLGAHATLYALWLMSFFAAWGLAEAMTLPRSTSWLIPIVSGALASASTFWFLGALAYSETALAVAVLTSAAILVAPPFDRRPWLVGALLGLIITIKLSGVIWAAALIASMTVLRWPVRDILRASALAAACGAPWWIRSFVITGNPLYPMAAELFGAPPGAAELLKYIKSDMPYEGVVPNIEQLLRLPMDLVQYPDRFGATADIGMPAVTAILVLLTFPVISRFRGLSPSLRRHGDAAAIFLLVAGTGWILNASVTRYFAPAFLLSLVCLAALFLRVGKTLQVVAVLSMLAAGVWGGSKFIEEHVRDFHSGEIALGREKPDDYLPRILEHHQAARFVREKLPSNARLLFIGETRPYYFARDAVAPTVYDQHPLKRWVEESITPQALAGRLAAEGFTHVVLNVSEFDRLRKQYNLLVFTGVDAEANERSLQQLPTLLKEVFAYDGVYVLEVPNGHVINHGD